VAADDRLVMSVTTNEGNIIRWGGDEPNSEMIPMDLTFGTSMPGGYKDLRCSLLRRFDSAERLFNRVRVYGPGNRTAWDGRLVQFPREDLNLSPGAVGHAAHLRDDIGLSEVFISRDLGMFQQAGPTRRLAALASQDFQDFRDQPEPSTGISSLNLGLIGPWSRMTACEAYMYSSDGGKLSRLIFDWSTSASTVNAAAANWHGVIYSTDRAQTTFTTQLDFQGTAQSGTADYDIGLPGAQGFLVQWYFDTSGGGNQTNYDLHIRNVRIIGAHGITLRGVAPDQGFYGHDLVQNIVSRWAPLLSAVVEAGGIEANTSFVVPHATFLEPTTAEDAVMMINGYFLYEWGVYDSMRFFWRAPDPSRLVWTARKDMGASVTEEGPTGDAWFNGVLVQYTDHTGQRRMAGPPAAYWEGGRARCDVTNALLVDTSTDNPVNAAGIPRRWGALNVTSTTTDSGAVQLGYVWLRERSIPQRRGTITVQGSVLHPVEGPVPVWRVKSGDGIVVGEQLSDSPRRIIETRYSHADNSLVATVGNPDYKIDAILERLGVQFVGTL
jgi:hypothetical protein